MSIIKTIGPVLLSVIIVSGLVFGSSLWAGITRLVSDSTEKQDGEIKADISTGADNSGVVAPVTVQDVKAPVTVEAKTAGRDQSFVGTQNVQNVQNQIQQYFVVPAPPGTEVTNEIVEISDGDSAEVWVIWKGPSWHNNAYTFDESKFDEFVQTSAYQRAIRESGAIACVGLVSSWMTDELRVDPDRDRKLRQMSDKRARILCGKLAEQMRPLKKQPILLGVGLGFNTMKAPDKAADQKQRALVLIHVRPLIPGRPTTKEKYNEAVRAVLNSDHLTDFHPQEYSEVAANDRISWFSNEEGILDLRDP